MPVEGVRIVGAWFPEPVDLAHGRLDRQLRLDRCRFEATNDFRGLRVDGSFSLAGSAFAAQGTAPVSVDLTAAKISEQFNLSGAMVTGTLGMNGLAVGRNLFMRGPNARFQDVDLTSAKVGGMLTLVGATVKGILNMNGLAVGQDLLMSGFAVGPHLIVGADARFQSVDLTGAKVGGQLALAGATVEGALSMNSLMVGQNLLMHGAQFQDVVLTNAQVTRQLALVGATVKGILNMNGLAVGQDLIMRGRNARFQAVALTNARITGQLSLIGATVEGALNMNGLMVGQDLLMRGARFEQPVSLIFACIGSGLDLTGAEVGDLDLSVARITGELRLGSAHYAHYPMTKWRNGARLTLRNAHAGALQDCRDRVTDPESSSERWEEAWPDELQLDGLTYDRLGGFGGTSTGGTGDNHSDVDMLARNVCWYICWLARDRSYTPQPYEQLAAVFRAAGEPTKADRILYASRERARAKAWERGSYLRWVGSSFLKWTIGYGLGRRYFRALLWVIAFTTIGSAILYCSGQPSQGLAAGLPAKVVYSLDQLLPIVEFEKYDNVKLKGGVAYYFYVHKLIGWLLGSFLVAGLAGLTQK